MKLRSIFLLSLLVCLFSLMASAQTSGEIIFSKTMINSDNPDSLTSQFQVGDTIYSGAFFDKSILDLSGSKSKQKVEIEVFLYELKAPLYDYQQPSEEQLETSTLWISGDALQKKYLPLDIIPSPGAMTAYGNPDLEYKKFGPAFYGPVKFAEKIADLKAGERTIIVRVNCNYNVVAEGRFTIKGDDYSVYKSVSTELNASASNLKTQVAMMPKAERSDKQLETEMMTVFKGSQTFQDRVKGDILRVVIIDPDWIIRRNELTGVILHRYIRATIAVKNSDGTCTAWKIVSFRQEYVGNDFQKTVFDGIGDPYAIPCENVNQ